jgi:addiction module HigA family antidote
MILTNDITPDRIANNMTPFEPTHPGEVLQEELDERGITPSQLAQRIGLPESVITAIITEKKPVTTEYAMLLEAALDIDADFWLNMQSAYDKYSDITTFESDVRAAFSEYKEFLKGNHKLKTEEEFWKEFYRTS